MKSQDYPVPTSVVRTSSSRIATYENRAFLAGNAPRHDVARTTSLDPGRGKPLLVTFVTAALVIATFLLAVAAAQADPAIRPNHATMLFGVLTTTFLNARQTFTPDANVEPSIARGASVMKLFGFAITSATAILATAQLSEMLANYRAALSMPPRFDGVSFFGVESILGAD